MNENTTIGGFYSDQHGNGIVLHSVCGQVARYIQSVSDAGDNPKLQETLENLKPYVFLGSTRNRICIRNCVMMFFSLLVVFSWVEGTFCFSRIWCTVVWRVMNSQCPLTSLVSGSDTNLSKTDLTTNLEHAETNKAMKQTISCLYCV